MRLERPHIPIRIRIKVAERQVAARSPQDPLQRNGASGQDWLAALLFILFGWESQNAELHHRPALLNRTRRILLSGKVVYDPPANDPDHLVYLLAHDHDIETRIHGLHGQYSDLALARKRKRAERKATRPKTKWPSRSLRSANRWPAKGTRP